MFEYECHICARILGGEDQAAMLKKALDHLSAHICMNTAGLKSLGMTPPDAPMDEVEDAMWERRRS